MPCARTRASVLGMGFITVACNFVAIAISVGLVTSCVEIGEQDQADLPREEDTTDEFIRNLGQGLVVHKAIAGDLRSRGEIFVAAVTKDDNDYAPKLRIFRKEGQDYMEEFVLPGVEQLDQLYIEDVNGDGYKDIISIFQGGQLTYISIVGFSNDRIGLHELLSASGGIGVQLESLSDNTKEVLVTRRTYEEEPGQPWDQATDTYHWDGRQFVKSGESE